MNIPLDVIERETGLPLDNREYPHDVITDFTAGAEWARKEALREAAESVRDYWATFGDLISSNNGARLAFEAVAARIAEGVRS